MGNPEVKVKKNHSIKLCILVSLESQFLSGPTDSNNGLVNRKENETKFIFLSFFFTHKIPSLKLRSSYSLRNDCEPGPR